MRLPLEQVARISGGAASGESRGEVTGVSVDSRAVRGGDLFAALKGDIFDGHDFVDHALRAGAAAALVSRPPPAAPGPLVVVPDTLQALARLAAWNRDVLDPIVVGITGSTGKTSTKDLLAAIVSRKFRTVAADRSSNNEIGVPLTLLKARSATEVVICELGARGAGQIRSLCDYVRPQVGIVTNVGVTHYEQFGSRRAIADAKGELIRSLPEGGTAVLNADDGLVAGMGRRAGIEVLTFGGSPNATVRFEHVRLDRLGRPTFRLVFGVRGVHVELAASGAHQVANAAAAAAAGVALGLSLDECRAGLEQALLSPWRMEVQAAGGVVVVNDAYNASPASTEAALTTCVKMVPPGGRLIAVLGHMAELGELERAEHERIGALAAGLVSRLIVVGERAGGIAVGARASGAAAVALVPDAEAALEEVGIPGPGDVLLVKASRVARLERVAEGLLERVISR